MKLYFSIFAILVMITAGVVAQDDPSTSQPYVGITFQVNDEGQPVIFRIVGNGPAAEAGLAHGDIITTVNGEPVTGENLIETILNYSPDDTITITVDRNGEFLDFDVVLGTRPEQSSHRETFREPNMMRGFIGIRLENTDDGVVIVEVLDNSAASEAGLEAGDVILAINGADIGDMGALLEAMSDFSPDDTIIVTIDRDGEEQDVEITLKSQPDVVAPAIIFRNDQIDIMVDEGALVITMLDESSPLAEAGLMEGDRITAVNGHALDARNLRGLGRLLDRGNNPETVTLTVERDGKTLEFDIDTFLLVSLVTSAMRDPEMPFVLPIPSMPEQNMPQFTPPREGFEFRQSPVRLGVLYITLDENIAASRDLEVTNGAYITEVEPDSPAEIGGLQVGDVITTVNGNELNFEHNLAVSLHTFKPGDVITLDILRDGETLQLEITLEQVPSRADTPSETVLSQNS